MNLLKNLKKFLNENLEPKKPVLFAYSGGVDSTCLLDLLLKCKDEYEIDLHVAHVDHGWREESHIQALEIQDKMKRLKITFHLKRLKLDLKKNLENESRNQRLLFFKTLFQKYQFQSLITAHQKDDLAETVLKRVLEGANIFSFTSMQKIAKFDGFTIFRPLLDVSRKDILAYLNQNKIDYYVDSTNEDTKFLRAKMRIDIFPFLQKNFNKRILKNLAQISSYSHELNSYLQKKTSKTFEKMKISSFGLYVDLNEVDHALELKFIIKKITKINNIDLSRDILEKMVLWLLEKKTNLRLDLKNANVFVDRGNIFILKNDFKPLEEKILVKEGSFDFGPWQVKVSKIKNVSEVKFLSSGWKDLFSNNLFVYLPESKYYICYPLTCKYLKKLWENNKVPAFLRKQVPIVCNENKATYDFLSGKTFKLKNKNIFKIEIKLK